MCSGSEAGSSLRLIDFVYRSTLGLGVITKKKKGFPGCRIRPARPPPAALPLRNLIAEGLNFKNFDAGKFTTQHDIY